LAFALDAVSAGEEVVLKDGVYHVGEISLSNSASKYVVIRGSRQGESTLQNPRDMSC
jgi:hypothetical protein